jgi:hypothetical protein
MKGLKSLLCLAAIGVMSASCVTLDGQLDVKQAMSAKKRGGFLNLKLVEVQIQPDLYQAHLKANSDKSYTLKLEGHDTILLPIKSEKSLNIPSSGRIAISHSDINQPFDVQGEISTDITDSATSDIVEECSWTVTENHCKKICDKPDHCDIQCKDEQVTLYGHHEVRYHYQTIDRAVALNLLKQDKPEVLASFHGTDSETNKITEFEGQCR